MSDQGLSIFDEQPGQSGKGSPDDKTQVIPVAQGNQAGRGSQGAPSSGTQRPVVPPAARPSGAPTGAAAAATTPPASTPRSASCWARSPAWRRA